MGETQRYPADFNGVLAGAPASITTELNSVLHEYTFKANYTKPGYAGSTILDQPEATILDNAAIKACDPKSGIILDDRACEQKFNLNSVACSASLKSACLTAAELAVIRKVLKGPVDQWGQLLYPGGYSLSSSYLWSNATSVNLPLTPGGTVTPASFITEWLQYLAFDKNYQAVVKANGGLSATQRFARYYALPGVGHCGGMGAPSVTAVVRQISLYPCPELPAYQGSGNVDDASSYVGKVSPALGKPVRWLGKFNRAMIWCNSQGTDCKEVKDKVQA